MLAPNSSSPVTPESGSVGATSPVSDKSGPARSELTTTNMPAHR